MTSHQFQSNEKMKTMNLFQPDRRNNFLWISKHMSVQNGERTKQKKSNENNFVPSNVKVNQPNNIYLLLLTVDYTRPRNHTPTLMKTHKTKGYDKKKQEKRKRRFSFMSFGSGA